MQRRRAKQTAMPESHIEICPEDAEVRGKPQACLALKQPEGR